MSNRSILLFVAIAAPVYAGPSVSAGEMSWQQPIEVDSGEAHRGPWRMNASDYRWVDDPSVAVSPSGAAAVVWVDQARKQVLFQFYDANGEPRFETPAEVSRSKDTFSWLPRVVLGADDPDVIHVLWQEIIFSGGTHGGEIFYSHSENGGRTFAVPLNLSRTTAGAGKGRLSADHWHNGSLDIAISRTGTIHAAWTEYEGALRLARSLDGGRSFSEPLHVAGAPHSPARGPALSVDDETVYLAWTVGETANADIHFARSDDDARTFGKPRRIDPGSGHADAPDLLVDRHGTLHLVYGESERGVYGKYTIRYASSPDGGETFTPVRDIGGTFGDRYESANYPNIAIDGQERVYVLWELFPDHSRRPRGLGLAWSGSGDDAFRPPVEIPAAGNSPRGVNGSMQGLLMDKLDVNSAGDIGIVNSRFDTGNESHVWLYRAELER